MGGSVSEGKDEEGEEADVRERVLVDQRRYVDHIRTLFGNGEHVAELTVFDIPPGWEKSTVHIPLLAQRLDAYGISVAVYREKRSDCLGLERLMNLQPSPASAESLRRSRTSALTIEDDDYVTEADADDDVTALSTFGYAKPEQCALAHTAKTYFNAFRRNGRREGRTPCASGCPRIGCRQHPAFIGVRMEKESLPNILISTHASKRLPPQSVAIFDERPQNLIDSYKIEVERDGNRFIVQPIDRLLRICEVGGLNDLVESLRVLRRAYVDAYKAAGVDASEHYRVRETPQVDGFDVDEVVDRLLDGDSRQLTVSVIIKDKLYPGTGSDDDASGQNLDAGVRADLETVAALGDGDDALWFTSGLGGLRMSVRRTVYRWHRLLGYGDKAVAIFDGTATGDCDYAAIPPDVRCQIRHYEPALPYIARVSFGPDSIGKGLGDANVSRQASYAVECLRQLIEEKHGGDVLIVTHKKAVSAVTEALATDLAVRARYSVRDREQGKARVFVTHFGNVKGENAYRSCHAVIVTHKHALPIDMQIARAMAIFGSVSVRRPNGSGTVETQPLPRAWTPLRRGRTGKNALAPALLAQRCNEIYSREVGYVVRSHLATEIAQAFLRSSMRNGICAIVRLFLPLGDDTELGVAILRQLPGVDIKGMDDEEDDLREA